MIEGTSKQQLVKTYHQSDMYHVILDASHNGMMESIAD